MVSALYFPLALTCAGCPIADGGGGDAGSDAGSPDVGIFDGGGADSGTSDGGTSDGGGADGGTSDGGTSDGGTSDGGRGDGGSSDAGPCGNVQTPCPPGTTETRSASGACGPYSEQRLCGPSCTFGPWTGAEITCAGAGQNLCPGETFAETCDASGNIATMRCQSDGTLALDHLTYGCTVVQAPGAGTRVCPGGTFRRACVGTPGARAQVTYTCNGTLDATVPEGGHFTVSATSSCQAGSGPEAGQSFCPGEVIERDLCAGGGLRRFFICTDAPGAGRSFSALADHSCGADSGEWVPIHAGVDLRGWVQNGHRFRALRIDLCQPGIALRATADAERGKKTSAFGPLVGALAAVNGGFFLPAGYLPDGCIAAGAGVEWPDSSDSGVRSTLLFGPGRVGISEAPNLDLLSLDFPWATDAVCGDATLVFGGVAVAPPGDAPRAHTAAGFSPDSNTLYLVTVDEHLSARITLNELGSVLVGLGVDFAINLDGGGSTTMWVERKGLVSSPTNGVERTVANHLAVLLDGELGGTHCH